MILSLNVSLQCMLCHLVLLQVDMEAIFLSSMLFESSRVPWEMLHIMVRDHFFLVDITGATAMNPRHILEMGLNKWATAVKLKGT